MKLPQLSLPLCLPSHSGSSSPLDMQPSRLASADDSLSISPPSNNNKNFETSLSLSRKSRGFWHAFVLYASYTAIYQAVSTVICWIKLNWLFTSQTWITLDERHPVKQILLCAMVFGIICNYISFLCIFLVENFFCHCFDYFFFNSSTLRSNRWRKWVSKWVSKAKDWIFLIYIYISWLISKDRGDQSF